MKGKTLAIILIANTLFAAFLGLFAQDLAYYFEEHLFYQDPIKMLTIVTIASVSLFIISFIITTILLAIQKLEAKLSVILLVSNVIIGFFVSFWSLFVLAMWWG